MNSKTRNIRANFANLAKEKEQEDRRKAEAERAQRMAQERQEQEEARRQLDVSAGGARGLGAHGPWVRLAHVSSSWGHRRHSAFSH